MTFLSGRDVASPASFDVDVIVIGSGAGGSTCALTLAAAGRNVLVLEEGADHTARDFDQREENMIPALFRELGGQRTDDLSILVLSGRGVGGSTVHNTNLVKRLAPEIVAHWRDDLGLTTLTDAALDLLFAEAEHLLGVRAIEPEQLSVHNDVMRRGVEALGWRGGMLSHNRDGRCVGSGFCELGCAYDAKLNARRVVLPAASDAGATIVSDARVTRIVHDGTRVSGVEATLLDAVGLPRGTLTATAPVVVLAASAIGSPALAIRSRVPDPFDRLGRGLHLHPGVAVAGLFDVPIEAWHGIPQSYECTEHLDLSVGSRSRAWLVPSFAHPVGTAAMMPGFGPTLMRGMREYPRMAVIAAMAHDETEGRVYVDDDRSRIEYRPIRPDRETLALGARAAGRILLAAGARQVSVAGIPPFVAETERELESLTSERFNPCDVPITAVHPMGSMPMGIDPQTSVCDGRGAHHQLAGLWVADGSLFPTSTGTPPQLPIYTFGLRTGRAILDG